MEKKKLGIGQYTTTSTCYSEGRISQTKVNMSLTDEAKAAVLEFLTESLDFHTLVCDIAGNVRKEVKPEKERKELKEECLHVCDRYKQLQEINNDLLRRWKDETAKRMKAQAALEDSHSHHNNVMNRIKDLLEEVDVPSVKSAIEALKAERAKGKLLAEQYELSKNENDKLAEDYNCLSTRYNNQKEYIAKYIEGNKQLTDKVEKLEGKLDKASKQYGELIKTISDRAIK